MIDKRQLEILQADLTRQRDQLYEQWTQCRGALVLLDHLLALADEPEPAQDGDALPSEQEAEADGPDSRER